MANLLKYSSDEFSSQTKDSDEKAVKLGIFHTGRLKWYHDKDPLNPEYTLMYERTKPLSDAALALFIEKNSVIGTQMGQTVTVYNHLKRLKGAKGLARDWYNRTAAVYAVKNPGRMKAIWSGGLKTFNGKIDDVIPALATLALNIGADINPIMVAIKLEVDTEYAIINPERELQVADIGATGFKYDDLTTACGLIMKMEYRNSGRIMDNHPNNENNIQESFHDMELLLGKQQTKWDISLNTTAPIDIGKRTQIAVSKLRALVKGGNAKMYLASTPGGTDSLAVELIDGVEKKFTAADFHVADYSNNRHITIVRNSIFPIRFKLFL